MPVEKKYFYFHKHWKMWLMEVKKGRKYTVGKPFSTPGAVLLYSLAEFITLNSIQAHNSLFPQKRRILQHFRQFDK